MTVSIITATSNSEDTIRGCLESIAIQDYPKIELIIIDNESNDNTLKIINSFDFSDMAVKVISEPDKGIYDALNKGIQNASGEIIGFLHSDDFYFNSRSITDVVNCFNETKPTGVYGDLIYVKKHDINKVVRTWKSRSFNINLLTKGWMPAHPTLFLRSEVYDRYGFFNTDYKISADYEFMLRILNNTELKFNYLSKTIIKMRVGGASNRNIKNITIKSLEDLKAIRSNNVGGIFTLILKNISKVSQFL